MRIWLIGADQLGTEVLRQLKKSRVLEVVVSDESERPRAVIERVIAKVDLVERVTAVNINQLAVKIRPDIIMIDSGAAKRAMSSLAGGQVFAEALAAEISAAADLPCILL
jgi:hypothetical protein